MNLTKRYLKQPLASNVQKFSCLKYEPQPDSKRCKYYLSNGSCARDDEFMCVEWLRANQRRIPDNHPSAGLADRPSAGPSASEQHPVSDNRPSAGLVDRPSAGLAKDPSDGPGTTDEQGVGESPVVDLFGKEVSAPEAKTKGKARRPPAPVAADPPPATPRASAPHDEPRGALRAPITEEEISSFKALGVELCIRSDELGEVWLVPEYTERDRKELSVEHAATLRLLVDAFPGSQIVAFEQVLREETA